MTKYRAGAQWLEPFVNKARGLVSLRKLVLVSGYRVPLDKIEQADAACLKDENGKCNINIRMYSHKQKTTSQGTVSYGYHRRQLYYVLSALAHELAHLRTWEHDWKHFELELKIWRRFLKILRDKDIQNLYIRGIVK